MRDVAGFREAVRQLRRRVGRTQQQLARTIGLHPDVLSHKLHQRGAVLTAPEVIAIVLTLAGWGAIGSQSEVRALLALMAVPPQAIPEQAWAAPPLASLPLSAPSAGDRPPGAPEVPGVVPDRAPEGGHGRIAPTPVPAPLTPLIGRRAEVEAVAAAVLAGRLVTLTGTGGTGKTRLAIHAAGELAGRFADGAAFADLAPVGDPDLMAARVPAP